MTRGDGARTASAADRWARRLCRFAAVAFAFGAGAYVAWSGAFPWEFIWKGVKTGGQMVEVLRYHWSDKQDIADGLASSVGMTRVRLTTEKKEGGAARDPVVLVDHPGSFADQCAGPHGCLAVEYGGPGNVGRRWPLRPDLLARVAAAAMPLEEAVGASTNAHVLRASWATPYPNGDLLFSFRTRWQHPAHLGAGRVGQDGQLLWFTPDGYSHHEAHVGAGDTVWVPGATFEDPVRRLPGLGTWECGKSNLRLDRMNVLDGTGTLVDSVSVLDAFLASRWAPALIHADPCDPFHLNSVSMVGEDVSGLPDVRPGDLVLSLRNMDAFAVLDRQTGVVKRYVRGSFVRQHSVKHLGGSEFVLFDNKGGYAQDENGGYRYSRVLVVDLASGEERVVFPQTPERRWYVRIRGRISLSPDRTRVVASFHRMGRAVEVRIADGAVLAEFDFVRLPRDLPPRQRRIIMADYLIGHAFYAREAR